MDMKDDLEVYHELSESLAEIIQKAIDIKDRIDDIIGLAEEWIEGIEIDLE